MKKQILVSTGAPSLWLLLLTLATSANGHVRMECPPSLSGKTGEKVGPCDVAADDGSLQAFDLIPNALNTVTWLESISHPGAPVRFALSREGGDENGSLENAASGFESCLLLDHIPHDALSKPSFRDQSTWHRSSITLWIPDVQCKRCYLQLISVMSDSYHGVPADTHCAYQGALANDESLEFPACPAVYHSCSPVSIDGTIPRNDINVCNTTEFEERLGWPLTPKSNPDLYKYSKYYNRGDVGLYDPTDARLLAVGSPITDTTCTNPVYCDPEVSFQEILWVPEAAAYTSLEGSCASVTESTVEAYAPPQIVASPPAADTNGDSIADAAPVEEEETDDALDEEEETDVSMSNSSSSSSSSSVFYATTATLTLLTASF